MGEMKKARHDLREHLAVIQSYIERDDRAGLSEYIEIYKTELPPDIIEIYCRNQVINALICYYASQARRHKIRFEAQADYPEQCHVTDTEVTVILGNLLDNAVEASQRIKDSYIEISATQREHTPFIIITMINSCACNPFSPNGELISSKPDPQAHGFGIKSIEKIVHNYNGNMQMYYDGETFTFHTIIMLKMKP